jgi:hypothetical protein
MTLLHYIEGAAALYSRPLPGQALDAATYANIKSPPLLASTIPTVQYSGTSPLTKHMKAINNEKPEMQHLTVLRYNFNRRKTLVRDIINGVI